MTLPDVWILDAGGRRVRAPRLEAAARAALWRAFLLGVGVGAILTTVSVLLGGHA